VRPAVFSELNGKPGYGTVRTGRIFMLTVFERGYLVACISGGWLYPLLALYFASDRGAVPLFSDSAEVAVTDPKIGRGAVFLYEALGISTAYGGLVSDLASTYADRVGIALHAAHTVPSLQCKTESLLTGVTDSVQALSLLEKRVKDEFHQNPGAFATVLYTAESPAGEAIRRYFSR
jgi:hypothetical protein